MSADVVRLPAPKRRAPAQLELPLELPRTETDPKLASLGKWRRRLRP